MDDILEVVNHFFCDGSAPFGEGFRALASRATAGWLREQVALFGGTVDVLEDLLEGGGEVEHRYDYISFVVDDLEALSLVRHFLKEGGILRASFLGKVASVGNDLTRMLYECAAVPHETFVGLMEKAPSGNWGRHSRGWFDKVEWERRSYSCLEIESWSEKEGLPILSFSEPALYRCPFPVRSPKLERYAAELLRGNMVTHSVYFSPAPEGHRRLALAPDVVLSFIVNLPATFLEEPRDPLKLPFLEISVSTDPVFWRVLQGVDGQRSVGEILAKEEEESSLLPPETARRLDTLVDCGVLSGRRKGTPLFLLSRTVQETEFHDPLAEAVSKFEEKYAPGKKTTASS